MPAHVHAALMAEYVKDATETDKPWERWEYKFSDTDPWRTCDNHPSWSSYRQYRRKRIPLCQVEGKDVFPGDKLWHQTRNEWVLVGGKFANSDSHLRIGAHDSAWPDDLSWTEPPKTKTVYQWAFLRKGDLYLISPDTWFATEEEVRKSYKELVSVYRLDYTALEVPV